MRIVVCPNCKTWEVTLGAADHYCGWCGGSWVNVECQASPPALYFSLQDRTVPNFDLLIRNTGIAPLEVVGVEAEPAGCAFFSYFTAPAADPASSQSKPRLIIAPGETRVLQGHFQVAALQALFTAFTPQERPGIKKKKKARSSEQPANGSKESTASLQSKSVNRGFVSRFVLLLAGEQKGPACTMNVVSRPEFELLTPTLEVIATGASNTEKLICPILGRIRLREGAAHVQHLESEIPGIKLVLVKPHESHAAGVGVENNGVIDFHVEVERKLVEQHLQSGQPLRTGVRLVCADPPGSFAPMNAALQIIPRSIPHLAMVDARLDRHNGSLGIKTWALAGRTRDFNLRLRNESPHELEIHAIEATGTLDCLKRKALILPLRIAPRADMSLPFVIDTQDCSMNTVITGALALRYRAEPSESHTTECVMHIDARVPQAFPGVAAIDFGAEQSCIALSALEGEQHVRLVKVHDDPFVPTAIVYHSAESASERVFEIGSAALSAEASKEGRGHVTQDFKPRIGQAFMHQVCLTRTKQIVQMPYDAIAADFLRGLVLAVEHHLAETCFRQSQNGTAKDFSRCALREILVISPTTFTFKQKEALRQALVEAGVPVKANVQLMPAPVVSACTAVENLAVQWQQEMQGGKNIAASRHLLVYEMGASATEVALLRVDLQPTSDTTLANSETWQVSFKTLGCEGDEQFGGNNLTSALAKYLAQQALTKLEAKFETKIVLPLWHRMGQTPGKKMEQVGHLNWKKFMRHAENLKCQFADLSLPARVSLPRVMLQVLVDKTFQSVHVENLVVPSTLIEKVVASRMALHIRRMQNLLRHAQLQAPDRIILAGKSALLPGVRKSLAGAFAAQGCEVEYASQLPPDTNGKERKQLPSLHDLKAAAAMGGAKYLRLLKSGGLLRLQDGRPMKTAMRIGFGLRHKNGMRFVPIIEKNVLIGAECAAPPLMLHWKTEIPIFATVKTGALNLDKDAERIGHFTLAQFKPALPADLDEAALRRALQQGRLRLKLTPHHELHVLLRMRGREHAIYFDLD